MRKRGTHPDGESSKIVRRKEFFRPKNKAANKVGKQKEENQRSVNAGVGSGVTCAAGVETDKQVVK